ncbi:MAG TPA: N(4)-(beta-N-acetylglucosaminyl)-L-asparaginase [Bacteroidota bacterium]|jgi:N4-(beta-N-acetylglucosaminyl)-L-asparaginase|nr:N(4)-(beta-N-acetylglucosaminyl)-L-asparaginase [Bacteroidota bacterium]
MKRRTFLQTAALAGAASTISMGKVPSRGPRVRAGGTPIVVHTWNFKLPVNETGIATLQEGGSSLDAVEKSIRVVEEDPTVTSVGRGGYPDRDGRLTLDACIMDSEGNAGSVMCIEHIMHPISVARAVMEKTPHVVLVGEGATRFAIEQGFKEEELLTDGAKKAYREWLERNKYKPPVSRENHDTIGLLAMDKEGNLAGGCSTSGLAWKMHGRVGDSPIIGAGLYVDNEIGAATSTGLGEAVIKISGSYLVVEAMRNGKSPQEACELAVHRIYQKQPKYKSEKGFFVGFLAVNKQGEVGAFSAGKGFQYSLHRDGSNKVVDADYLNK